MLLQQKLLVCIKTPRLALLPCLLLFSCYYQSAKAAPPDTVKAGIYITSIHDIDFKQKEYTTTFWLWLRYKNKNFNFLENLEVPLAKTVNRSFATIDSSNNEIFIQMKLECIMKDSWKISNFPFDHQYLRLSIENSQYDNNELVFVPDTAGQHYDPRFALTGWTIDSCLVSSGNKAYETAFGDKNAAKPHTEYSAFRVKMSMSRDASGLFWKMFLGMYIAFLIAYLCFYIHADSIDSRFSLSVGSLFAVVGNKYIIDASLPESTSFTLVDALHGLTLFSILIIIMATTYSLYLTKQNKLEQSKKFDLVAAQLILLAYVSANVILIVTSEAKT